MDVLHLGWCCAMVVFGEERLSWATSEALNKYFRVAALPPEFLRSLVVNSTSEAIVSPSLNENGNHDFLIRTKGNNNLE
jgi:hypothetical protein